MATATGTELERLIIRIVGDNSGYKKTLSDTVRATEQASRSIEKSVGGMVAKASASLQALGAKMKATGDKIRNAGAMMTLGITTPIVGAGLAAIKLAANLETVTMQYKTMLGEKRGLAVLQDLQQYANTTPFQFSEVSGAGKTLLAFGVQTDRLLPSLKMLGDVAAGTGADLDHMATIYGQIKGAGVLKGQDFMQLLNIKFPIDELYRTMNMGSAQFKKAMENDQIPWEAVQETLRRVTAAGGAYYKMAERLGKTTTGTWSTLVDNAITLGQAFGEILIPYAMAFMKILSEFVDWLKALNPEWKRTILFIGAAAAAIGPLLIAFGVLTSIIAGVITITSSWLGITVAACAGIAVALLAVTDVLGVTSVGFGDLFNAIRVDGTGLGTWFGAFALWLAKLWNNLTTGMHYAWSLLVTGLKALWYPIIDVFLLGIQKIARALISLNKLLPKSAQMDMVKANYLVAKIQSDRATRYAEIPEELRAADNMLYANEQKNRQLDRDMQKLFVADPQDGSKGVSFDKDKALQGFGKIGSTLAGAAESAFGYINAALPRIPGGPAVPQLPKIPQTPTPPWAPAAEEERLLTEKYKLERPKHERAKTDSFQQIALNRFSLAGLTGDSMARHKQQVEAEGVEKRLDKVIEVLKNGPNAGERVYRDAPVYDAKTGKKQVVLED